MQTNRFPISSNIQIGARTRVLPSNEVTLELYASYMAPNQDQLLKDFDTCFADMVSLFRLNSYLTNDDQLFIENRIVLLQLEYKAWIGRRRQKPTLFPRPL